jgi:hypothetical protein
MAARAQDGNGRVALAVVERRRDGKLHPVGGRLPEDDHERAVALAHWLRCHDRLSYRQVVEGLATEHGLRVSLGSVFAWCQIYTCRYCRPASGS